MCEGVGGVLTKEGGVSWVAAKRAKGCAGAGWMGGSGLTIWNGLMVCSAAC